MMRLVDKELETAVEVEMAGHQYDNLKLHTRLLARLKDRSAFSLNVLIDDEQISCGSCALIRKKELTSAWHRSLLVAAPSGDGLANW